MVSHEWFNRTQGIEEEPGYQEWVHSFIQAKIWLKKLEKHKDSYLKMITIYENAYKFKLKNEGVSGGWGGVGPPQEKMPITYKYMVSK